MMQKIELLMLIIISNSNNFGRTEAHNKGQAENSDQDNERKVRISYDVSSD